MFFWMVLASLMGIAMFGNMFEKNKDQEDHVVPVYEAMALSTLQQHSAAERAYAVAIKNAHDEIETYIAGNEDTFKDGIVPMVTVENGELTSGGEGAGENPFFPLVQGYLPPTYKPQDNTRTYLFCVSKDQKEYIRCNVNDSVRYIITLRTVPRRNEGASKMTALKAISRAASNSRYFGMLHDSGEFLESGTHQPLGARYNIQTAGNSDATDVYIPNFITCNFPLKNDANEDSDDFLGDHLNDRTYIVALSMMGGLNPGENLEAGGDDEEWKYCFKED